MPALPPRLEPLRTAYRRIMDADPFLMSAAIAYNAFFALVPLAFAAVAALSMFSVDDDAIDRIQEMVVEGLPDEVGAFLVEIIQEAEQATFNQGTAILVISLLIALWSGSRAIYTVQKALRLIEHTEETRPYWKKRGLGILFTLGAGIALIVGYVIVIFGGWLVGAVEVLGIDAGSATGITGVVLFSWVTLVLYAIYEWGTPTDLRRPFISAITATGILAVATALAALILPELSGGTVAALGSVGVVLAWAYAIGLVVIVVPASVPSIEEVIKGTTG